MAFLVREGLEKGHTLADVLSVFRDNPRTCEYYYVVSDAKTNEAVGMEASWDLMQVIKSGEGTNCFRSPSAETAIALMDRPVAMKSNLHNVLFEPKSTASGSRTPEPIRPSCRAPVLPVPIE